MNASVVDPLVVVIINVGVANALAHPTVANPIAAIPNSADFLITISKIKG